MKPFKCWRYHRALILPGLIVIMLFKLLSSGYCQSITTGSLVREMVDLERLANYPDPVYKTVQFSSYDRRSIAPDKPGWFSNSDGFGKEPVPGFIKVLREKDDDGIGEYLICDVEGPGAIVRLWTARIYGDIRLYLDNMEVPIYEGPAQEFFWNTYETLKSDLVGTIPDLTFHQNTAGYYPIPFAKRCRMEWTGNMERLHFYHVELRLYEKETQVNTFQLEDLKTYRDDILRTASLLKAPENIWSPGKGSLKTGFEIRVAPGETATASNLLGPAAIRNLSIKVDAGDLNDALRSTVMHISFDGSSDSQIQSPLGDFFLSAPGINPYRSLPFTVKEDGWMLCRFVMPFRDSVSIRIKNLGKEEISIKGNIHAADYEWKEGESMHFRARWRIDHDLIASHDSPFDLPYLLANGRGMVVGAAALLMNPTSVPTNNGNWWGEGDEKIFVDRDTFPSFFGTGSEDYYNYAWSSPDLFSHGYCGQPRNDGPGNRGHVTNFRWHILDPIPFNQGIGFYMELLSHGTVPGFSYGRMVYYYGVPGIYDDHIPLTRADVEMPQLPDYWTPEKYRGSSTATFFEAEEIVNSREQITLKNNKLWTEGRMLLWTPQEVGEELEFTIPIEDEGTYALLFTVCKSPDSGAFEAKIGNQRISFRNSDQVDLNAPYGILSRSFRSSPLQLEAGLQTITLINQSKKGRSIGIDFIWTLK